MAFNLEHNKNKVSDIKKNVEIKKGEVERLEITKQEIREAGMEIQSADLDDKTMKIAMEGVNQELESISEKGKEIASEMNADIAEIESMKQETQLSMENNENAKKKIEEKKSILDKLGLGKGLEASIGTLDANRSDLESFNSTLIETGKELDSIHQKLNGL